MQASQTEGQWYSDTSPLVFPGLAYYYPASYAERVRGEKER